MAIRGRPRTFFLLLLFIARASPAAAAELPPAFATGRAVATTEWSAPAWQWRRLDIGRAGGASLEGDGGLVAVAVDPARPGRAAVGHAQGVSLREPGERFRFAARVGGVTDLGFARDGSLWIASLTGLWQLTPERRLVDRSPAPGELARAVRRVLVGADRIVAATDAGAWVGDPTIAAAPWTRLADGLPRAPVSAVVGAGTQERPGSAELLLAVGRELWRVAIVRDASRWRLGWAVRLATPGAPTGELPLDLLSGPGGEVVLLFRRAIVVRELDGGARVLRPVLPPGAQVARIARGAGRVWLATDQGLLHAPVWSGPWRRSESPAGRLAVRGLAETSGGDAVLAASPSGLLRGAPVLLAGNEPPTPRSEPHASPPVLLPVDPGIRGVQAASLRYLGLGPGRMQELRDGLRVRGWIPSLSLRVAAARDRTWGRDDDQSFLSGETRFLRDEDRDDSLDLEASIVMTWDLGSVAFDGDAIDLSREHRQVVSLRDNVLDEINQIYFERSGLLEKLRGPGADDDPERSRMALRAAELAAGLDAWTGGWFSEQLAREPGSSTGGELLRVGPWTEGRSGPAP